MGADASAVPFVPSLASRLTVRWRVYARVKSTITYYHKQVVSWENTKQRRKRGTYALRIQRIAKVYRQSYQNHASQDPDSCRSRIKPKHLPYQPHALRIRVQHFAPQFQWLNVRQSLDVIRQLLRFAACKEALDALDTRQAAREFGRVDGVANRNADRPTESAEEAESGCAGSHFFEGHSRLESCNHNTHLFDQEEELEGGRTATNR